VGTLLHATVYMFLHNLLNVLVHIANKMGLQKNVMAYGKGDVFAADSLCCSFVTTAQEPFLFS
jgi:hypothetical protein